MLTRNFYIGLLGATSKGSGYSNSNELRFKIYSGNTTNFNSSNNFTFSLVPSVVANTINGEGLMFGSNNAPETVDDYTISILAFSTTVGASTGSIDEENRKITITKRYILNNAGASKTINEFGIMGNVSSERTLLFRKVIEPFTIESNETVNFDLVFEYEFPVDFTFM